MLCMFSLSHTYLETYQRPPITTTGHNLLVSGCGLLLGEIGHIEEIIRPQSKGCAQSEAQPYWFVFHIFKFQYSLVCVCESSRWILYIPSTAFWQRTRRLQGVFLCSTLFVTNFTRHQLLQTDLEKHVFHHSVLAISLRSFTLVYMSKRCWTRYWTLSPFTI